MPGYQNQTSSHKEQVRSTLDTLAREGAQSMLISAIEQGVEEFLGRARYSASGSLGRALHKRVVMTSAIFPGRSTASWGEGEEGAP